MTTSVPIAKPSGLGWSHAWKADVVLLLVTTHYVLSLVLPPRYQVERHWGSDGVNWFGHGPGAAYLFATAILVLLCSLRFLILTRTRHPGDAVVWYAAGHDDVALLIARFRYPEELDHGHARTTRRTRVLCTGPAVGQEVGQF